MDSFDPGILPPIFPELEGLVDNDNNSESAFFKDVPVYETEPVIAVTGESSFRGDDLSTLERELTSFTRVIEVPLANSMRGSESPVPETDYGLAASQPDVSIPSSSNQNSQHLSLPVICTDDLATARGRQDSRRVMQRGYSQTYRDKIKNKMKNMKMRIPGSTVKELEKESRKAAAFSPEVKMAKAVKYLEHNQCNNPLVKKYTAEKIARRIYANDEIKLSSDESKSFPRLRRKVNNAILACEATRFCRIYHGQLERAFKDVPANLMRGSESPLPKTDYGVTASQGAVTDKSGNMHESQKRARLDSSNTALPPEKVAKIESSTFGGNSAASQPDVAMPSSSDQSSQHLSLPAIFIAAPATTQSHQKSQKMIERSTAQRYRKTYRAKKSATRKDMEMKLPDWEVKKLSVESRKAAAFSPEAKIAEAVKYLENNQCNHPLVEKYTAEKIARHICANDKIKLSSDESQHFPQLRKKVQNAISACVCRRFRRNYDSQLKQATGNT